MSTATGSISMSGLLGGNAGKIDTDALIDALMQAKAIPQNQLKDKLAAQQKVTNAYQQLNSMLQSLTKAAQAVTDVDFGSATAATSSSAGVIASSTTGAATGSSTFTVTQLAAAQVSTVAVDADGTVADPAAGIDITVGSTTTHLDLASGNAADVAGAINAADGLGVRAAVINTDQGQVLQLTSLKTGTENAFTAAGFSSATQDLVAAQDAQIQVGTVGSGGYTISSATNTFTDAMPGVTFSVGAEALGQQVTVTVSSDVDAISRTVKAMVDAANSAKSAISTATGKGGILQGHSDIRSIGMDLASAISMGTADGKSLTDYGVDMDRNGVITFDAAQFAAAYAADAKGTVDAIAGSLGASFKQTAESASAPVTGTLTQTIASAQDRADSINDDIDSWNERLDKMHDQLVIKYTAMQTALAKLQSQGDWLTSMFKSMQADNDD